MHRIKPLVLLLLVLLGGRAATVTAQDFPDFAYVSGQYDGSALQLQIRVNWDGYRGAVAALDVYRTTLGLLQCGPEVRITDEPLPYPSAFPASVDFTDSDVTPGACYRYEARPVDANRNPVNVRFPIAGFATSGVALLVHGNLFFDRYGGLTGYAFIPCPQTCLADGILDRPPPNEVLPYVDTDTTLLMYGEVVGIALAYNSFFPMLRLDRASPAKCVVGVESQAWGSVKRLYK